jgi:hypothetical protein
LGDSQARRALGSLLSTSLTNRDPTGMVMPNSRSRLPTALIRAVRVASEIEHRRGSATIVGEATDLTGRKD